MSKFASIVLLCVLGFYPMYGRAAPEKISTRFGIVDVSRSSPESSPDTLRLDGRPVYTKAGNYIGLYRKFVVADTELVLFGVNCGGTGCPNDDLFFLRMRPGEKPKIVSADTFYSLDGTVLPRQTKGGVIVDLGYDGGKRKTATLRGDALSIALTPEPVSPMKLEDCQWLHEYSMSDCISAKSNDADCRSPVDSFPGVTARGLAALSNHPGFVEKNFQAACVRACVTGRAPPFDVYKKSVCGIR